MLVTLFQKNKTNNTPIHFLLRRKTGVALKTRKEKQKAATDHKWKSDGQQSFFLHFFSLSYIHFLSILTLMLPTRSTDVQILWSPRKNLFAWDHITCNVPELSKTGKRKIFEFTLCYGYFKERDLCYLSLRFTKGQKAVKSPNAAD